MNRDRNNHANTTKAEEIIKKDAQKIKGTNGKN
jgi:hypothetical protein